MTAKYDDKQCTVVMLVRRNRDLRIDFFRGLALWWIFIDHMPANVLADYTLHNFALADAAEVFVFLAGYAGGIAYGRRLERQGWFFAAANAVKRAWILYSAHILLFLVFTVQVAYSAHALDRANYLEEIGVDRLSSAPYSAIFHALILSYQPSFLNILPLYVVLLLFFAAVLPLLRKPVWLAFLSLLIYVAARLLHWNMPSWTSETGWYFNPFTWQILFVAGSILSYSSFELPFSKIFWDVFAVAVIIVGLVVIFGVWNHQSVIASLPSWLSQWLLHIDKTNTDPLRLASLFAMAWLASRLIPRGAAWLGHWSASLPILLGQHSLPVFCFGILLSFLGRLGLEWSSAWPMQIAVNVTGVAVMLTIAWLAAWYTAKNQGTPASASVKAPPV